ncbi:hypothetical protein REPUB_Repub14bG0012500 [Reevesia pubescens]
MRRYEEIQDMTNCFNQIINGLKALDKTYSNKDMVNKFLNSLPKSWEVKVTTIEESKDLNTLSLEDLIGSLITYEMKTKHREMNQNKDSFKEYGVTFNKRNKVKEDK